LLSECVQQSDERNKVQNGFKKNFSFCTFFHQFIAGLSTSVFIHDIQGLFEFTKISPVFFDKISTLVDIFLRSDLHHMMNGTIIQYAIELLITALFQPACCQ
jgi:hypothetical protein